MSFYQRYELVRLVHNGEPKTFEAREISSARPVLLHLWSMGEEARSSALLLRLRDLMRTDPAVLLGSVVEVQEAAAPPYVVTTPEEGFPGLEPWLAAKMSYSATHSAAPQVPVQVPAPAPIAPAPARVPPPVQPPVPPPAPPPQQQGEFTRMFGSAATVGPSPSAPPPAAHPPPHPASQPPPQPASHPAQPAAGEFTRLFGTAPAPEPIDFPAAPATPPPPEPAFQVAPPFGPPQAPPAKPPAPSQPGEFTKLFGSPLGANPLPVEQIERGTLAPPPSAPSERPFRGPSEFTIQFGHNEGEASPPPPPPEFNKNLAATGLFAIPLPQQAPPPNPAQPSGPGEFTRIMMRPEGLQIPQPPQPPAPRIPSAPPAPGTLQMSFVQNQKPWLAPLIAVLTTVVVLLLIAIIVILLKR